MPPVFMTPCLQLCGLLTHFQQPKFKHSCNINPWPHLILADSVLFSVMAAFESWAALIGWLDILMPATVWLFWGGSLPTWVRGNVEPIKSKSKVRQYILNYERSLQERKESLVILDILHVKNLELNTDRRLFDSLAGVPDWQEPMWAEGAEGETVSWGWGEENKTEVEREEERGREAVRTGVAGSQRASRSGLLSRGMGVMSAPGVSHAPWTPEEEERRDRKEEAKKEIWKIGWSRFIRAMSEMKAAQRSREY